MARSLRRPAEVLDAILAPLRGKTIEVAGGAAFKIPRDVKNAIVGDCDEHAILAAAGPAVLGIETALRFGGHWDRNQAPPSLSMHHVWGLVLDESTGIWWNLDTTVKNFRMGQYAPFEQYAIRYIFRDPNKPEG